MTSKIYDNINIQGKKSTAKAWNRKTKKPVFVERKKTSRIPELRDIDRR